MIKNIQKEKADASVVVKSGIWFTLCNILTKGIGFFTTPIFTRLLTKSEFGDYNNFTTWTGIILFITSLNLESSFIRARFDYKDDLDSYIVSMICLSSLSTIIWFVLFVIFINPAQQFLSLNREEIYAMFLYLMFYPIIQLYQTRERFEYRYKNTVTITLLVIVSTAILSVALVLLMENRLLGRIMGTVIPIIIIGIILFLIIFHRRREIKIKYWSYALPFTLPFVPHLLSMYLLGSMDKIMIRYICGSEDLALYSLAYTVGTIISLLITSMNNAFSPWLGEQLAKKEYNRIRKISVPYISIFILFSIITVLITPEILLILGGEGYLDAKYVIPQIFAGSLMQFIYCMYVNVEQFEKKTMGMAIASVIAAIFNYVTNYVFINYYGYIAASYTTFFSYLLLMLLHMWLVWKIGRKEVFDNLKILVLGVVGSLMLMSMNFFFKLIIVRYMLFLFIMGTTFFMIYRKRKIISCYIIRR